MALSLRPRQAPKAKPEEEVSAPPMGLGEEATMPPLDLPMTPVMPRRASVRETIDDPVTLAGIEKMYNQARPSFSALQTAGNTYSRRPELLAPIQLNSELGTIEEGGATRDANGNMHDQASVPRNSLGLIHTHPYGQEPETSPGDEDTANALHRPNYALSGNALWVAEPGNPKPRKVANLKYKNGHLQYEWMPVPIPIPGAK